MKLMMMLDLMESRLMSVECFAHSQEIDEKEREEGRERERARESERPKGRGNARRC